MPNTIEITELFLHFTAADNQTVQIVAGTGTEGNGAGAILHGGESGGPDSGGGFAQIVGGNAGANANGGNAIITSGWGGDTSGSSGNITLNARDGVTDGDGGSIDMTVGNGAGGGSRGHYLMHNLPTSDPHVADALYLSAGTVKVSAG